MASKLKTVFAANSDEITKNFISRLEDNSQKTVTHTNYLLLLLPCYYHIYITHDINIKKEAGEQKGCYGIKFNLLYKQEDVVSAGASKDVGSVAVALVRGGSLGHGDNELALGVGGGGQGGARAGREAEPPPVELEGRGAVVVVFAGAGDGQAPHDDLGDAGVDLDGVGAGAAGGEAVGGGDEAERRRVLLDGDVGVGGEGELEHPGEDVREAAQLLRAVRRGGGAALHGDGALPRGRMDPHGAGGEQEEKNRGARNPNPSRARGRDRGLGGGGQSERDALNCALWMRSSALVALRGWGISSLGGREIEKEGRRKRRCWELLS